MSVDTRIVNMVFNNKDFEKGVSQTTDSLHALNESLKLSNSSNAFSGITEAAKAVDLSAIGKSVEAIEEKFSAFNIIAIRVLQNITDKAMEVGEQFIKSVSIDQVSAGWEKYATKTQSVQTIIAATGKSIEEVTEAIDQLNWFTDETSYNLTDMTTNISRFTSNGVDLDVAVSAMEGIADAAGLAGSGVEGASHAMEGFSKAIAQNYMSRQNWSWIKTAKMDTVQFKQAMLDAAVALKQLKIAGKNSKGETIYIAYDDKIDGLIDDIEVEDFVSTANFESMMKDKWLTSEVMLKALGTYGEFTGALYEMADAFNANAESYVTTSSILDYLDQYKKGALDINKVMDETGLSAKELNEWFSKLSDSEYDLGLKSFRASQEAKTFAEAIDSVKDAVSTGWMTTFETLFGNYEEAKVLWTQLANDLYDVFAEGGNIRNEILDIWSEAGGREALFGLDEDNLGAIWNIFYGIVDLVNAIKAAWADAFSWGTTEETGLKLADLSKRFQEFTEKIRPSEEVLEAIQKLFGGVFKLFKGGLDVVGTFGKAFLRLFGIFKDDGGAFVTIATKIGDVLGSIGEALSNSELVKEAASRLGDAFTSIATAVGSILGILSGEVFQNAGGDLGGIIKSITETILTPVEMLIAIFGDLTGLKVDGALGFIDIFRGYIDGLVEQAPTFRDILTTIKNAVGDFVESAKEKFPAASTLLTNIWEAVKNFFEHPWDSISAIGDKIAEAWNKGLSFFTELNEKYHIIETVTTVLTTVFNVLKTAISGVGEAFKLAWKVISYIGEALIGVLKHLVDELQKLSLGDIFKFIVGMLTGKALFDIASAFDVFKKFVSGFTGMWDELLKAITKGKQQEKQTEKFTTMLLKIAIALKILSTIDTAALSDSTLAIVAILRAMMSVAKKVGSTGTFLDATPKIMKNLGTSVLLIAVAAKVLSGIDGVKLAESVAAIILLIRSLRKYVESVSGIDKEAKGGVTGLVSLSVSLLIIASAVKKLSSLEWTELLVGLVGLEALLWSLFGFVKALGKDEAKLGKIGIQLILVGVALNQMAGVVKKLGKLEVGDLAKGVGAVVILLAAVAAVAHFSSGAEKMISIGIGILLIASAMKKLIPVIKTIAALDPDGFNRVILALAVSITALVAALVVLAHFSTGMVAAAAGMLIGAAAILVLAKAIGVIVDIGLDDFIKAALYLAVALTALAIPMALAGAGLIVLGAGLTVVAAALLTMAAAALLVAIAIKIVGAGLIAIGAGLAAVAGGFIALSEAGGLVMQGLQDLIVGFIAMIPEIIGRVVKALGESAAYVVEGLVILGEALCEAVIRLAGPLAEAAMVLIDDTLRAIANHTEPIIHSVMDILTGIISGVADGAPAMDEALVRLAENTMDGFAGALDSLDWGGLAEAMGFLALLAVYFTELAAVTLLAMGATAPMPVVGRNLSGFAENIQPFVDSISEIDPSVIDGAKNLADAIGALTVADLMNGITSWLLGEDSFIEFGKRLEEFAPYLKSYSDNLKGIDNKLVEESSTAAKALAALIDNLPKSGIFEKSLSKQITDFSAELPDLATNLHKYSASLGVFDATTVQSSANAAVTLAQFAGTLPAYLNFEQVSEFAEVLPGFGQSLADYSNKIADFNGEKVALSITGIKNLTAALNDVADSRISKGNEALDRFFDVMPKYGQSLSEFSKNVKGYNSADVIAAGDAAFAISNMIRNLPSIDLVFAWTENNDLARFGIQLKKFAPGLNSFATSVEGMNVEAAKRASDAGKGIGDMINHLANASLIFDFIDKETLPTLGKHLVLFAPYMYSYSQQIKGIGQSSIDANNNVLQIINDIKDKLPSTSLFTDWFGGRKIRLMTIGKELEDFGPKIQAYTWRISKIDQNHVESAKRVVDILNSLGTLDLDNSFFKNLSGESPLTQLSEVLPSFGNAIHDFSTNLGSLDSTSILASKVAADVVVVLANNAPSESDLENLEAFLDYVPRMGEKVALYGSIVDGISTGSVNATEVATNSIVRAVKAILSIESADSEYIKGLSDVFPHIAEKIKLTAENADGLDISKIQNAEKASKSIAAIITTLLAEGVDWLSFGENDFMNGMYQLPNFGRAIVTFANHVEGIKVDAVKDAVSAAESLTAFVTALPKKGDWLYWFVDTTNLVDIGWILANFAPALVSFATTVSGINTTDVEAAVTAGKTINGMLTTLPPKSYMDPWLDGDLVTLGQQLSTFSPHLKIFANNVYGITESAVTGATNGANALFELLNHLPDSGLFAEWFGGTNKLESFGEELVSFGDALVGYFSKVEGITVVSVDKSTRFTTSMVELMDSLGSGNADALYDFNMDLQALGTCLSTYASTVSNIDWPAFNTSLLNAQRMADFADRLSNVTTWTMTVFGENLQTMANAGIDDFIGAFQNAGSEAYDAGKEFGNELLKGINDIEDADGMYTDSGEHLLEAIMVVFEDSAKDAYTTGQNFAINMADGISKNAYLVTTDANSLGSDTFAAIETYLGESKGYNVGYYTALGISNGMSVGSPVAVNSAAALANKVLATLNATLEIKSPSRKGIEIGYYLDKGLANGLLMYSNLATTQSEHVGNAIYNALSSAVDQANSILQDGNQFTPVITPILDLSNFSAGASQMQGMIDLSAVRGASYYTYATDMSEVIASLQANQNGSGIAQELSEIRGDLAELSNAVTNMQIVMDGDIVVGQIAPRMDSALGQIAGYKGRGN